VAAPVILVFLPVGRQSGLPRQRRRTGGQPRPRVADRFFRVVPPEQAALPTAGTAAAAIAHLSRGLALANFRRELAYLCDEAVDRQPKIHRRAIRCRKLPNLRRLRSSMPSRALHANLDTRSTQARPAPAC